MFVFWGQLGWGGVRQPDPLRCVWLLNPSHANSVPGGIGLGSATKRVVVVCRVAEPWWLQGRPNGRMAEWRNGGMAEWRNGWKMNYGIVALVSAGGSCSSGACHDGGGRIAEIQEEIAREIHHGFAEERRGRRGRRRPAPGTAVEGSLTLDRSFLHRFVNGGILTAQTNGIMSQSVITASSRLLGTWKAPIKTRFNPIQSYSIPFDYIILYYIILYYIILYYILDSIQLGGAWRCRRVHGKGERGEIVT